MRALSTAEKISPIESNLRPPHGTANPYVIEPPEWGSRIYERGEVLSFSMVLIGNAREKLPLVVFAWQRAFARDVGHGTGDLRDVFIVAADGTKESIYDVATKRILPHENTLPLRARRSRRVIIIYVLSRRFACKLTGGFCRRTNSRRKFY